MSILLISDVHLCITTPNVTSRFLNFLKYHAIYAKALYILGDLFEIWLGDDICHLFHINIANALQKLQEKKIPCYFIHGNHDFLLGKKYANFCGMTLLPVKKTIKLSSGKTIIILHGDILCIHDTSYQKFRKWMYHLKIQKIFLSLPVSTRLYLLQKIRYYCIQRKKHTNIENMNIDLKKVIDILTQNNAEIMIHGHIHQSAIYKIFNSNKDVWNRIVLGSWDKYGSMIEIHDNESISLIEFPVN